MASKPKNIVLLVADSLRWDTVYGGDGARLPYAMRSGVQFRQARSGGCWTLPATASLFTGLSPHEHGADSQTRSVLDRVPTLAERMRALGYSSHMITANVATTEVFGLDRGFDTLDRIWKYVPAQHKRFHEALVLVGKPRLRKRILSADFVAGKLSEDLDASKVWLQSTYLDVFEQTRQRLREGAARNQPGFYFLNLMETHFPYHVADTFETSAAGLLGKIREVIGLFHLVNQTWLTDAGQHISPEMLAVLRNRQRLAWERIAPMIDAFCQELREEWGATVVFAADHGDNFGEQDWLYHFSNVTDAGNRVPLIYLPHDHDDARTIDAPVSARHVFGTLLRAAGDRDGALTSVVHEPEASRPILESFWYNNQGKTLDKFKVNQFGFLSGKTRFVHRTDSGWYTAPAQQADEPEQRFVPMPPGSDPIAELTDRSERQAIDLSFSEFSRFSDGVLARAHALKAA